MKQSLSDLVVSKRLTAEQGVAILEFSKELENSKHRQARKRVPGLSIAIKIMVFLLIFVGLRPSQNG